MQDKVPFLVSTHIYNDEVPLVENIFFKVYNNDLYLLKKIMYVIHCFGMVASSSHLVMPWFFYMK